MVINITVGMLPWTELASYAFTRLYCCSANKKNADATSVVVLVRPRTSVEQEKRRKCKYQLNKKTFAHRKSTRCCSKNAPSCLLNKAVIDRRLRPPPRPGVATWGLTLSTSFSCHYIRMNITCKNLVQIGRVVPEIRSRTDKHRQTRSSQYSALPYRGRSNRNVKRTN